MIDRLAGDSAIITARFSDSEQPDISKFLVTLKVRSSDGTYEGTLVERAGNGDDGLMISEITPGEYLATYAWAPDSAQAVGAYDVYVEVERRAVMVFLTIIVVVGVLSTLIYFYFSKEHTGVLGVTAKVGIWFIMISFGAHFGYTVMGRVSLLIGRVQFLIDDWIGSWF
jgi:hypothetical protein